MQSDKELMQMALDALECSKEAIEEWGSYASPYFQAKHNLEGDIDDCQAVIEALRARLAQPEPEPVALGDSSYDVDFRDDGTISVSLPDGDELVIVPPQPKQKDLEPYCYTWDKWISSGTWEAQYGWKPYYGGKRPEHVTDAKPLYATPPQREWQGLTDEEIREFEIWLDDEEEKHGWNPPADIVKYIEAKLKEKNAL